MKTPEIILPKRIAILREQPNQDVKVKDEEFGLYYANFIHPIYPWYDIFVDCKYGKNYKNCWKINEYPDDVHEFDLTIKIFDECGKLVTEKKTVIELFDQDITKPFKILCVGDSLTHHMIYPTQMQTRLKNVITCGTRSYDGHVFGEGRGGWQYETYFTKHSLKEGERGALSWVSPFLFPKNVSGRDYFGDMEFYEASKEEKRSTCCFNGFEFDEIKEGQIYHKYGKLYKSNGELFSDTVEWEFNFKKYLERNNIENLDAVSILLGANDLFPYTHYDGVEENIKKYIDYAKKFVKAIKDADEKINVIINLPIPGSEQNTFAHVYKCLVTYKQYAYAVREGAKALLKEFEGKDGIYICPMAHVLDTENGYDRMSIRANLYSDNPIEFKNDAVHPNPSGYRQMGDALAGTVEMLRHMGGVL